MRRRESGFTLIEVLVASAILSSAFMILLGMLAEGHRLARALPEAADLRQRVRVAADMLQRDLQMAGAGIGSGPWAGPLTNYLPSILPMRTGARSADPELSFFDDRITILYAEAGTAAAPLVADMPMADADVPIDTGARGCPAAGLCGFEPGTRALLVAAGDAGEGYDLFSVSGLSAGLIHGSPDPSPSRAYPRAGTLVVPVRQRVYHLDRAASRLMVYDGYRTDLALVENVVSLRFEYFADPWPASVPRPAPGLGNCLYAAGTPPAPLLADLGGSAPVPIGRPQLTDGPICGVGSSRFDGDLLRIRRVRVTIRAQAADRLVRGTGPEYAVPGLATAGTAMVPDLEVTFDVTPRNLQATR